MMKGWEVADAFIEAGISGRVRAKAKQKVTAKARPTHKGLRQR